MGVQTGTWPISGCGPIVEAIRNLGFPNMDTGPFVAGGAVRRIFDGQLDLIGFDIDIFPSEDQPGRGRSAAEITKILECRGSVIMGKTMFDANNKVINREFTVGGRVRVQVMYDRFFPTYQSLLDDIDYTVCLGVTDGWSWAFDDRMVEDMFSKTLRMSNTRQGAYCARRLGKYCSYGYTPEPGVLSSVLGLNDPEASKQFVGGFRRLADTY